jgi:hypothetical protein
MPDPLIELALRVHLSGVPPAYGSWLLTPRPPLHEGEKQPVGQEGREEFPLHPANRLQLPIHQHHLDT